MRIKMTKSANIDLSESDDFIRENNPLAADRMASRIDDAISHLAIYPAIGRIGRVSKTREFVVSGTPFVIIYQVRTSIIVVYRVLHTAQKWPKNNKNKH